jgi:shikimate dehydrogenase
MNPRYAVIGHPVAHSLSPTIHLAFGRQRSIPLDYVAIDAGDDFTGALESFFRAGGLGCNVTQPFKIEAAAACVSLAPRAQRAGSANTLIREGDGWRGDNTDGVGLVRDLTGRHGLDLRARRTLLLGAGGAARGIVPALLDAGIGELVVVNRTPEKADALADAIGEPRRVHARYYEDLDTLSEFELVINATSAARAGLALKLPPSLIGFRTAAVDLSYGADAIAFLAWARAAGAYRAIDGLGMLVEQAAESFALWHGVLPDTDAVYADLRERESLLVSAD